MASTAQDEFEQRLALLDEWTRTREQIAALEARSADLMLRRLRMFEADVVGNGFHRDAAHRSMLAEYSAAGRLSQGTVERMFLDAHFVDEDYPQLKAAFARGAVTPAHVHEVISAGFIVRDAIADGRVDARTLLLFETAALVILESETPARARVLLRELAAALAGESVTDRHRRARRERTVTVRSVGDGLALLQIVLPEHLAVAILDRLTQIAREVIAHRDDADPILDDEVMDDGEDPITPADLDPEDPTWDDAVIFGDGTFATDPFVDPLADDASPDLEHPDIDDRGIDEVRADLATDLLLGADPTTVTGTAIENIRGRVHVTLSADTLAGRDERPACLDGHGPIDPDAARDLAGRTTLWSRLFLDANGMLVETDSYTPTAEMRRHLQARDQRCRFPGCRMPVHRCQVDHNDDYAKGGCTCLGNLAHLCVAHHVIKHPDVDDRHRWTARQLPSGELQWTSPLGHIHTDNPPPRVMFV